MNEDLKSLAPEMQRRGIPPRYFAAQMRRGMSPQEIFAAWPKRPPSERIGTRSFINREVRASDAGLDERLVQNRNLAFRTAYQLFAAVALLAWPLSLALVWYRGGTQGWTNAIVIYAGASLLATTLPVAIWAWREPDPAEPEPPTS
jgi:hypothetical protein